MYGAIMLLKVHLGKEPRQAAKSACTQRFLGLYYKHIARQETSDLNQLARTHLEAMSNVSIGTIIYHVVYFLYFEGLDTDFGNSDRCCLPTQALAQFNESSSVGPARLWVR
ncbi:hypothetical protein VSDG_07333 [Cytospora chrysosperma]|uniref:Uncharacterized protein n=1 Tax=Cytospora chrysosperma TaxID=252740 RepID=A0A423VPV4_CYTCH|nr:hypothetical protein VSDG_07333 [Valsa sordida]